MNQQFWLVARDKPGLLIAIMRELCGNAHISFEGNLAACDFSNISGSSELETEILKHCTVYPKQNFMVLPLEQDTIQPILKQVLPAGRVVHDIIHIQIEKDGEIEFGSYDNFHPDCIVCGFGVSESLLRQLFSKGVLRSIELASEEHKVSKKPGNN